MKNKFQSYFLNVVLILSLTTFVLYFTLKDNYVETFALLKHAKLSWLFIVFAAAILYQAIIGLILKIITNMSNSEYKFRQGFVNALVASFFHGITPSASGGQFAQVYVFKKQNIPFSDSASILWMDFILYQSTMVASVLFLLLIKFKYFYTLHSEFFILVIAGFVVNSLVIVGLYLIVHYKKLYSWITTVGIELGSKIHLVKDKEKTLNSLNAQLERFDLETKKLKNHRPLIYKVVGLNLIRLTLYYSIPFFCAKAIGIEISQGLFINVLALSSFVAMINCFIPLPGASGGTEATYVLMFSTIFSRVGATSTMILWRFSTYYLIMFIGGITFAVFKLIDRKKEV